MRGWECPQGGGGGPGYETACKHRWGAGVICGVIGGWQETLGSVTACAQK